MLDGCWCQMQSGRAQGVWKYAQYLFLIHFLDGFPDVIGWTKSLLSSFHGTNIRQRGPQKYRNEILNFTTQNNPSFPLLGDHNGFDGYVNAYKKVAYKIDEKVDASKISYYHSLSELFTRKYQQITMLSVGSTDNNAA